MRKKFEFNRFELSGCIGDLGTLIPIGIGMVLVNNLSPSGIFLSVGLFYIITGYYYGIPTSVQPMKVIASYAIATSMTFEQIQASCILMSLSLLLIGSSGVINSIEKYIPNSVVRGVQLSTGLILMTKGVDFVLGTADIQKLQQVAEPYFSIQHLGILPIGVIIGTISFIVILLDNKKIPSGIVVLGLGFCMGLVFGIKNGINLDKIGLDLSNIIPSGFPTNVDFSFALITLVIPQIPMTIGNAVIANKDLSVSYFGDNANKVTSKALCITMAFGNFLSALLSGMPLCHGAGGLAAHYRFGARSAGSNLIIGGIFIFLAILLGDQILRIVNMIPLATLGVLLLFAGSQLAMAINDVKVDKDMFVIFLITSIAMASNLGLGVLCGIITNCISKFCKVNI